MVYLKSLIGRHAGQVADYPVHASQNLLQNGSHVRATEHEIVAGGFAPLFRTPENSLDEFPEGYAAIRLDDFDGFDVFNTAISPTRLNDQPFRNLAAARSFATDHAEHYAINLPVQQEIARKTAIIIPDDWRNLSPDNIHTIALLLDASTAPGDDALLVVASEEDRRRELAGLPPLDPQTGEPLKAPEPEPEPEPEPAPKSRKKSAASA